MSSKAAESLADALQELDIGVDGGQQHSLDPGRLIAMRRWIIGVAVVNFDIDTGPVVDQIYPPMPLDASLKQNIAFSSFPDASASEFFADIHSFRIRQPASMTVEQANFTDGFVYGFAYFCQKRDAQLRRGYLQRSVVVLTHLPYPSLFTTVVGKLGPLYFDHGTTMLETACHNFASWRPPKPGTTLELGFLGSVQSVVIPVSLNDVQFPDSSRRARDVEGQHRILASTPLPISLLPPISPKLSQSFAGGAHSAMLLTLCRSFLPSLWSIWECLLLCEPILVFAPQPSMTSAVIWWLRDLVRPLPSALDFRPYFTIHDKDFNEIVPQAKSKHDAALPPPKSGLILGVTNPYFEKACSHWPHVLSLGPVPTHTPSGTAVTRSASLRGEKRGGLQRLADAARNTTTKSRSMLDFSLAPGSNFARTPPVSSGAQYLGPEPGWHTKTHARYISKDRGLIDQLHTAVARGGAAEIEASWAIRKHFAGRTIAMLAPLNRYLATLLLQDGDSKQLKPFNDAQFFSSLETHGAALPFRSTAKRRAFYERWMRTPAFGAWLADSESSLTRRHGSQGS